MNHFGLCESGAQRNGASCSQAPPPLPPPPPWWLLFLTLVLHIPKQGKGQLDVLPERGKVASRPQHANPNFNPDSHVFCGICAKFWASFQTCVQTFICGLNNLLSWPGQRSLTAHVSQDWSFFLLPWPPHISSGSHGPLSGLVNFALSAPWLLAYECPSSLTYSTAVRWKEVFKIWSFLRGECEKTGGDIEEEGVEGGLAGCFHSCHGDELGSYD